ncbi:MAG: acyl-[acyl-carrier-protein] thioesterase [Eubacterium sp.]|nr:acyl-[acyl-carrier-protein] thioesterase [Eubacterium sp.]
MYTFDARIRYSETDSEGKLTLASLLNYFQDASTFHSEDLGVGVAYNQERKLAWVLSSWQIVVERFPRLAEKVIVGTFPTEFKAFMGTRNFFMQEENGEYLAKANSVWTLLSTETGKPALPTETMLERYVLSEKLPMDYASRKVTIPEGGENQEEIIVKKHHLDTNHHVNNGQYVSIAMEYLPENFEIRQMRAEYKKQAYLDDVFHPYVVETDGGYVIALLDEKGKPYVSIEFLGNLSEVKND